jgi:hypothetical protein
MAKLKKLQAAKALRKKAARPWEIARPLLRAWRKHFDLKSVYDRTGKIRGSDILLFCTLRNETWRMPYFLDYYRGLGIRHFLFVDNGSTDGFLDLMKEQEDCSVWYTEASYRGSRFGMDWMNHLLRVYGTGHWCLTCDPDELLVYPRSEERKLGDLAEFLRGENRESLFCLMLDMYGDGPWNEISCSPGENPLSVAPFFDGTGYVQWPGIHAGEVFVQGGVRRRHFFRHSPANAPAINKTPFVFWRRHYAYTSSMHMLNMYRLNRPHKEHVCPTGCILHFKLLSNLVEKAEEELNRRQHFMNSIEYRQYLASRSSRENLMCEISQRYVDTPSLMRLGLMSPGQWF